MRPRVGSYRAIEVVSVPHSFSQLAHIPFSLCQKPSWTIEIPLLLMLMACGRKVEIRGSTKRRALGRLVMGQWLQSISMVSLSVLFTKVVNTQYKLIRWKLNRKFYTSRWNDPPSRRSTDECDAQPRFCSSRRILQHGDLSEQSKD
jgi:hypothetical protein